MRIAKKLICLTLVLALSLSFFACGGGSSKVCVVSKNGKDVRTLFNFKGNQSYPQWSKRLP